MLCFEDVSFSYPNKKHVIQKLSFQIEKGEFVAIVGPNGSGKSTISKLADGLILPKKGRVLFQGLDTKQKENLAIIRKSIGIIFQNPEEQLITTNVFDEVIFGLENIACPPSEMVERAEAALEKVGMLPFRETEPHKLSGGQKQRVAIAAILAMEPKLIIFDESTSMLDPDGRHQIISIMRQLHNEGITILHITHHMNEVLSATKVIVINQGQIVSTGTPLEIFHKPQMLIDCRLELPFALKLKMQMQQEEVEVPMHITDIEGMVEYLWNSR
ncbi:energy-coupling factor transporter ATPase [Peribacillus butanolivorans]|uniref:energy-coupling factor transporter ATPase n=1 Tax=Peribacillus butanolivorans TaxID=421767 RepID=UPI0036C448D7